MATASRILTYPGEYDDVIPENISLAEFILNEIEQFGDDVSSTNSETMENLTFREIVNNSKALAAGLQTQFGIHPKENVAIVLPSCLEYPVAVLGVNYCGAAATLINPSQTISELKHAIKLANPKVWIATEDFLGKFHELFPNASQRPPLVLLKSKTKYPVTWEGVLAFGMGKPVQKPVINSKEDTALILFSSGTTGVPKGVCLTHANYIAARRQNVELTKNIPRNPEDLNTVMLPLYHTFGISSIFDNMVRGLRFILVPHFTFKNMLEAIQKHKISIMSVVPAIATQLVKQPVEKHYDLSSLRLLFSGAAALSKEIQAGLVEKFGCFVFQGYGMTESTLRTHSNFIGSSRDGSIGTVMPFCESIVVDPDTNKALGPNEEGEICVRGPLIMKGYIGDESATKHTIDSQGWLHTGDIGYYDEDGFFFITDRMKELIKYKGLQVSPTELEQILLTHPDIIEAAVAPVPDEAAGELPRAYVVKSPGSTLTEDDVAKFVADKVSAHKRLRGGVVFIKAVPKTATGKILRRELKKIKSKL
ncbi:4-coumarate--CoA ligase 1-like [Daphnia pulicaria]|uniref:4-coumarate--CoA ligase 1-like n=1 Tax=Daphnia pulicaria TaxID=35523 RepID=UPI001EEBFD55|nr:4-coumarate--CoA ligase 1-like [Daphnia pulicaria]